MVMETLQIRLGKELISQVDSMVDRGVYSSRSDAIRDAVRRLFWYGEAGTIPSDRNGMMSVKEARRKLSSEKIDIEDVNSL